MTTAEARLAGEKAAKLAEVADRAAAAARRLSSDPDGAAAFLSHYFRHVEAAEVVDRSVPDLLGLVESHYRLAQQRPADTPVIAVWTPTVEADGWSVGGATVVQIVTDDQPFLVDSVTMEVTRQGWSIREVVHPQFTVRRGVTGALQNVVPAREAAEDPTVIPESWMHLEVTPPERPAASRDGALVDGLRRVLRDVSDAVADWPKMRQMAADAIATLADVSPSVPDFEVQNARELLGWLVDDHFTFLGYREYRFVRAAGFEPDRFEPVPFTGLGILRGDTDAPDVFHALPQPGTRPWLMVITKGDFKATVHRPAYLDYLGLRVFDAEGRVVGERRFLGLFASTAYSESVLHVPVLRPKALEVLRRSGYAESSHGGKAVLDVLEGYPRDELFQATVAELAPVVEQIAHLRERRQVRVFLRREPYGRYLSCLVFLPRDRYTTAVRNAMQATLLEALGGSSIEYTARVSESVLARLQFVVRMPRGRSIGEVDVPALERRLTAATRSWSDDLADELAERPDRDRLAVLAAALPEGYKEDNSAWQAILDLQALAELPDGELGLVLYAPDEPGDEAHLRLKVFRRGESLSLSRVLPHLSLLGVDVIDERPYTLELEGSARAYVYDFGLQVPGGRESIGARWSREARHRFTDAFAASYSGVSEADGFQALVTVAELQWRQVAVLRAVGRYLQQGGSTFSQAYLASALTANVDLARLLVELFETRFGPRGGNDRDARAAAVQRVLERIDSALDDVVTLDHDKILRSYRAVLRATLRTNVFQPDREVITLKLQARAIPDLPLPRPEFEIFAYSPRLEGVHLRFGAVARGGVRWSDRAEDFRTEILGLAKAQMVKNTVIVPVGAKGGFYCKRLPDPAADRDGWLAEGVACYRLFVGSLLDVTDNLVQQRVVPPDGVVRYDGDDPYLVVAADKGTATFSDYANEIALQRGFWLGDAFASGGSSGYDHKRMGITARGAWESVRRHFRELGIDPDTTDFTCVGIGDMSGDVFGNGMLLSRHTKLVAAFDHRHVFVDPDPDPVASFDERARLFALPRSSWADYDPVRISSGGGVFPRTRKSIPVSAQMRAALGLADDQTALSPPELISAILCAPVDLLFNGGIGTYVRASSETAAAVGDKANDALRVTGTQLRARSVGEGGNLGFTQLGRIEYAAAGGKINTDFIDNSAGVDTSDHEVNLKILYGAELQAGRLTLAQRDAELAEMTDEVAALVLHHNDAQNLALANSLAQAASMAGVHEDWMERLEAAGLLDRRIEYLPSLEALRARRAQRRGLTAPELAVLLAYTKIALEQEILRSDLPDDPALAGTLVEYFPSGMRRYAAEMPAHPLHREILTTVVVNSFVDSAGITCFSRLSGETGAEPAEVLRAHLVAGEVFGADRLYAAIGKLDHQVEADVQTDLRLEVRTLVERGTRWMINNRRHPLDVRAAVHAFAGPVQRVQAELPAVLSARDAEAVQRRVDGYRAAGVPDDLAVAVGVLPSCYAALTIVQTSLRDGVDLELATRVHFVLGQHLQLDRLLTRIVELPRENRWQTSARAALRDDLHTVHAQLTAEVVGSRGSGSAEELVDAWERTAPKAAAAARTLATICDAAPDLARMSVGLRVVRGLLPATD